MIFRVRIAKTAGFCFGVHRALDKVLDLVNSTDQPVRTHGPLIHNNQVLDVLRSRSVFELGDQEDPDGKTVVIRAHGVTPDVQHLLKANQATICNATCPKVAQVQGIVKKYSNMGCLIAIIGDAGHAEVDGLLGYARGQGVVVAGPDEAARIESGEKICIVAQTTQSKDTFDQAVSILKSKFDEVFVFDTICNATSERQAETIRIARQSDLMIVVGGKKSANTKRLADIAANECPTLLIQSADDLNLSDFENVKNIGVTAGASTPSWIIRDVVVRIRELGFKQSPPLIRYGLKTFKFLSQSQLLFALGLGLLGLCLSRLSGLSTPYRLGFIGFWFAWMWAVTEMKPWQKGHLLTSRTPQFFYRFGMLPWLLVLVVTAIPAFVIAGASKPSANLLFFVAIAVALVNGILISNSLRLKLNVPEIKSYRLIKDIVAGLAVGIVTVGYPHTTVDSIQVAELLYILFVCFLVWVRSAGLDMRNYQVDLIKGSESLPLRFGESKFKIILYSVLTGWIAVSLIPVFLKIAPLNAILLVGVPLYYFAYFYLSEHKLMTLNLTSDYAIDAGVLLAAIISLVIWFLTKIV